VNTPILHFHSYEPGVPSLNQLYKSPSSI
jgi:hypothetical protein